MTDIDWGCGTRQEDRDKLESSAVTPAVAAERGYRSITTNAQLDAARFSSSQRRVPGLLIPLHNVHGENAGYVYRPDSPRDRRGRPVKYETRAGQRMVLDVPPRVRPLLGDPGVPLWITEGPIKADAAVVAGLACVALLGVWNWRGSNIEGGSATLGDFEHIAFNGRRVIIAFDSDAFTNRSVYDAARRLAGMLRSRNANVEFLHLPDLPNGAKAGLDDHLALGHTAEDLWALVDDDMGPRPEPNSEEPTGVDGLHLTELGNAQRLVMAHGDEIRYVTGWGAWMRWTGTHWAKDDHDVRVSALASDVSRVMWDDIATFEGDTGVRNRTVNWAKKSESAGTIRNTVTLARSIPGVAIEHTELDAQHYLLNCENFTIDLADPELTPREHRPDDLITKKIGARWDHNATCPTWLAFLEEVLPDPDVRDFVQRCVGYSLTGDVSEQVMFLMVGEGANGKSTFVTTIEKLLGDYAGIAAKDLLVAQRNEAHPTSMADLHGVRFAVGVETEQSNVLAEAKVKQLTGGDQVKARRMRENFWSFDPTHKLWIATNYLPRIRGTEEAIWRRMKVIPFEVTIPAAQRDGQLPVKLQAELDGILQWAVDGYLDWVEGGLQTPTAVEKAVQAYRADQDWFERFIEDMGYVVDIGNTARILRSSVLGDDYRDWCRDEGEAQLSSKALGAEMTRRGFVNAKSNGTKIWRGIEKPVPQGPGGFARP